MAVSHYVAGYLRMFCQVYPFLTYHYVVTTCALVLVSLNGFVFRLPQMQDNTRTYQERYIIPASLAIRCSTSH